MKTRIATDRPSEQIPSSQSESQTVRVWDPLVRLFHWTLVVTFAVAFLAEDELLGLHVWAGYLALTLVGIRVLWGLIGTRHARFSDFVRGPRAIIAYLRECSSFAPRVIWDTTLRVAP